MEGFEELKRLYRESLPQKRQALELEWRAILGGADPEPHAQSLRHQLHQLSGSGGAYGYDAMGEMARSLEKQWVQWLADSSQERPSALMQCSQMASLMRMLLQAMRAASLPAEA